MSSVLCHIAMIGTAFLKDDGSFYSELLLLAHETDLTSAEPGEEGKLFVRGRTYQSFLLSLGSKNVNGLLGKVFAKAPLVKFSYCRALKLVTFIQEGQLESEAYILKNTRILSPC